MALKPTYEDLEQRIRDLEKAIAEHRDISSEMEKSRLKLTEAQNVIKSEAQKAAILNGITTNLAFVNEKFEILWANKASAESVGKTLSELIGKKCHELWADPQAPCDGCPTVKAFETRKTEHLIIRTPDGRVWDEKGEPVFDENGEILGVLEIAHDITEKIRAEEALKESENRYRALVENSSELIFQVGTDGRFTFANRSFYEVLDYTRAETEILNGFDLVHPDDLEMVTQQFGRLMKGEKISLEYRYQKKDGRYIYLHNNAVPLLDKNHQIVGALGVARDISSQKETELALKKSEQKFKELFDSITDLIYVQDLEGRFLSFNPAMQKLLDYEKEEMIGRKTSDFMDPKWRPLFESDYLEALKQNGYQEGISVYCRKDGQKLYLEYRSKLVYPEEGEPYITGMGRDVTPRITAKKDNKHLR